MRERIEPDGTIVRYYINGSIEYTKLPDGTELHWFENGEKASEKLPDGTEREWFNDRAPKFEKLPDGTVSRGYYIPQPNAVYVHEVYHVWETTYAHPIGKMTKITSGNYDVYDKARHGFRKEEEFFNGVIQSKTIYIDGKRAGFEKYRDGKVFMSEMTFEGKNEKHYYNSNGEEISEESFNLTETKRKKIREQNKMIALTRINKEKQIEAQTGVKTRFHKMSKIEKKVAIIKVKLGLAR